VCNRACAIPHARAIGSTSRSPEAVEKGSWRATAQHPDQVTLSTGCAPTGMPPDAPGTRNSPMSSATHAPFEHLHTVVLTLADGFAARWRVLSMGQVVEVGGGGWGVEAGHRNVTDAHHPAHPPRATQGTSIFPCPEGPSRDQGNARPVRTVASVSPSTCLATPGFLPSPSPQPPPPPTLHPARDGGPIPLRVEAQMYCAHRPPEAAAQSWAQTRTARSPSPNARGG
jgi:hypothetical protein